MDPHRGRSTPRSERGFALIEVVVSALILVATTGGVIKLLNATGRSGAEERHKAQAYALAQEDQARMRGMQISSLNHYKNTSPPVNVGGTNYTVKSKAFFVNDKTAVASCSNGNVTADYVQISSEVSWATMKANAGVLIESIVSPATGSLDPTHGTLNYNVVNAKEEGISGVILSGVGVGTFSGSTDETGCAVFPDLPEGNYKMTPTLPAGYVDEDGDPPAYETVGVVGDSTITRPLVYDHESTIEVGFKVKGYTGVDQAAKDDAIVYVNSRLTVPQHTMGTVGGTEQTSFKIKPLFPFTTSAYSIYAGCPGNNPGAGEGTANVFAPSGATATATLRLPALYAKVWTGRNSSNQGSAFANADVWVRDDNCSSALRRFTTNSSGQLNDPGFPWSRYDLCADTLTGSATSGGRRQKIENVEVKSMTTGTTVNFYLGSGTSTVSTEGQCS